MLRLVSLKISDFGPFKGSQIFPFPAGPGVTIFYGENMRGKTTLLNALRFALFGKVVGRGRRAVSFHDMVNWEARSEGRRTFAVELEMTHAGGAYRLIRTGRPRGGGASEGDEYSVDFYLERNGHILPREQAERELEQILPEQTARFFLFDGELLQEYEDLLHGESDMGPKISTAIERVLGLPVLTGARDSLKGALERAETRLAIAAQGDQKTRDLGSELQVLVEEQQVLTADLFRQEQDLERLRARKVGIENDMRRRGRLAQLLDKRDRLIREVAETRDRIDATARELKAAMAPAWSIVLGPRIEAALASMSEREAALQASLGRLKTLEEVAGGAGACCPTCLQTVGAAAQAKLRDLIAEEGADADGQRRELAAIRRRSDALAAQIAAANPAALKLMWRSLEDLQGDIHAKTSEIDEIAKQLVGVDEDEMKSLRREYEVVVRQIAALEDGSRTTAEKMGHNANDRERLQRKLDRLGGGNMAAASRRRDAASRALALFSEAVDVFRDQLKKRVEADASRYFRTLTTEADYRGLRINDTYGLTIQHRDGGDILVRSAGAEHVVALSLVAALQNNAPMRGPIVIDSPFGRLDGGHTTRIVNALPDMADQVLLLVYEDELPQEKAREALAGRLCAEWTLDRVSARHTELRRR